MKKKKTFLNVKNKIKLHASCVVHLIFTVLSILKTGFTIKVSIKKNLHATSTNVTQYKDGLDSPNNQI